jgi:hypothetical protein
MDTYIMRKLKNDYIRYDTLKYIEATYFWLSKFKIDLTNVKECLQTSKWNKKKCESLYSFVCD